MRKRGHVAVGAVLLVVGAGSAVAVGQGIGPATIGDSGRDDARVPTVVAQAVPAEADVPGQQPRVPEAGGDTHLARRLGILRRSENPNDSMPPRLAALVTEAPVMKDAVVRRVQSTAGTGPLWLAVSPRGAVFLAGSSQGVSRAAGYPAQALANGMLMRVYESVPDNPEAIVVSGFLADDARDVKILMQSGAREVQLRGNFYSELFERSPALQPRELTWADGAGAHSVAVPLSPDAPR